MNSEPVLPKHTIFVVSDATGATGLQVVEAALTQFETAQVIVKRVPNVPLLLNMEPPSHLFQADPRRVVGLTIQPERLVKLRQARLRTLGRNLNSPYANPDQVQRELEWAEFIFRRGHWPVVDVTNKSIEEAASEIVALVTRRTGRRV